MAKLPPGFQVVSTSTGRPANLPEGFDVVALPPSGPQAGFGEGVQHGLYNTGAARAQDMERAMSAQPWESALAGIAASNPIIGPVRNLFQFATSPAQRLQMSNAMRGEVQYRNDQFNRNGGPSLGGKVGDVTGAVIGSPVPGLGAAGVALKGLQRLATAAKTGALAGAYGATAQPITEGDYETQRGQQALVGGTLGAGIGAGMSGALSAAERLLPKNAAASVYNWLSGRADPKFVAESERLVNKTGVKLSPAAISGSKTQTMMENAARQSVFSRDQAFTADQRAAQQIHDYIGRVMNGVRGGSVSADEAGKSVQSAIKSGVNRLAQIRESQAAKDYGVVRQMIGNGPSPIRPIALADKLQGLVDEYGGIPGGDAQKISRWAQGALNDLEPMANDLQKLIRFRSYVSKASKGAANLFDQVNPGENRRVAAQLVGAIESDLERASMELPGNLGSALKAANANYSAVSKSIEAVEKSPLGRLLGDDIASEVTGGFNTVAPEKVIDRIRGMTPSEVGMVRKQLEQWSPDSWSAVKRRVLEDALSAAESAAPSEGANTVALRGNKFITALTQNDKNGAKMRAMFNAKEVADIRDAFATIQRFGDKTGYNHSGTAAQQEVLGVMNSLKEWSLKGAASAGGAVFGSRAVAKLMMDEGGRRAVMQLSRLPPQSRQAAQLAAYISALIAAPEANNAVNGSPQQPQPGAGR